MRCPLNESPSEKEGKSRRRVFGSTVVLPPLNESPSEKEGKLSPSMKSRGAVIALNESPSEKEGKFQRMSS